jgi:hypothetical protein
MLQSKVVLEELVVDQELHVQTGPLRFPSSWDIHVRAIKEGLAIVQVVIGKVSEEGVDQAAEEWECYGGRGTPLDLGPMPSRCQLCAEIQLEPIHV